MPDHRQEVKILHLSVDIIFIAVAAVICGAEDWEDVQYFGEAIIAKTNCTTFQNKLKFISNSFISRSFSYLCIKIFKMKYDRVKKNVPQMLSLTGLTVSEFDSLLTIFKYAWDEYYAHFTLDGKVRQRISYNRKTGKIPLISDKLLFILSYLKNNPL